MDGPQNGLPHTAPMTPPATAPTGPATTRPVPAPAAAPTMSARALEETATIALAAMAARTSLRITLLLITQTVSSDCSARYLFTRLTPLNRDRHCNTAARLHCGDN